MAHIRTYRTARGEKRYLVRWREAGTEKSRSLTRERDARMLMIETERRLRLGVYYVAPPETFETVRASFLDRYKTGRRPATVARMTDSLNALSALDDLTVDLIGRAELEDAVARIAARAPRQAQLALAAGKRVLADARDRGQQVNEQALRVRPPRHDERLPRFLAPVEVELLALNCVEGELVRFAAYTGARQGEALALDEDRVDVKAKTVTIAVGSYRGRPSRTKTAKVRRLHLCGPAASALRRQLAADRHGSALVFPAPKGGMWRAENFMARVFRPARDLAGLVDVTFHDLRHTFASLMVAAGANPLQIAEALGHTDRSGRPDARLVWTRYGHLYPSASIEAARQLDAHLRRAKRRKGKA